MSIVKLVDHAPVPVLGEEMKDWLNQWLDNFTSGNAGHLKSIILIAENSDGQLGMVSQSTDSMDRARLIGLLTMTAHERMEGGARAVDMG